MKYHYLLLVSILLIFFLVSCSMTKPVYKSEIIYQEGDVAPKFYDKVIVYKINSNKDSLCYYKEGDFLGSTIIIIEKK